ncbi:LysE family translocator [Psychromonas ossibalaenae]|uniref:LysE family translocator n=1 Tax=Psychromonas ossibalaenae TaxID=444922 RepID=UPI000367063A|nr:LysE family translocator [Psychromonas ossibalaenae]
MELSAWISLAAICLMGAMTPGPSLIIVLKHTVSGGRLNGFLTSIAHGLGVAIYALLTVIGLAIIIESTPWLFNLIKYAGVILLLWLAYKALMSRSSMAEMITQETKVTKKQSFREGLLIAFLNPKLAIFFLALFSQFVDAQAGWQQNAVMVATVSGIDTLWYCLIALILSQSAILTKLRNNVHIVEKVTGIALLAVAARIAF